MSGNELNIHFNEIINSESIVTFTDMCVKTVFSEKLNIVDSKLMIENLELRQGIYIIKVRNLIGVNYSLIRVN